MKERQINDIDKVVHEVITNKDRYSQYYLANFVSQSSISRLRSGKSTLDNTKWETIKQLLRAYRE
ncbi:hypothetical protein DY037_05385 [Apilactobacillus micheneri]|uniref:hypothetical protein n=1 Tax=Apilactobacillus micheneri TaxID=1899430 RepID=UPI00112BB67F|nr:hypothetical protein [Apilactobacillus micheneri]TPR49213.1 hypothetical protein DY037_05385 [Apilactobacillus micheneri]